MVRIYRSEHVYDEPPQTPLLAYYVRYPNPFARHVLSVDVIDRFINPTTGQLHTKRLILKRGILPKWASKWLPASNMSGGRGLDAWILEESIVDPPFWNDGTATASATTAASDIAWDDALRHSGQTRVDNAQETDPAYGLQPRLRFIQANLNHRKFMHVIESGELHAGSNDTTLHKTQAEIKSDFGGAWSSMIRQRIESYAVGKFEVNTDASRKGMSLVMTRLRSRQPLADTAEFYPPPPPQFGESWPAPGAVPTPKPAAQSPLEGPRDGRWFWQR